MSCRFGLGWAQLDANIDNVLAWEQIALKLESGT